MPIVADGINPAPPRTGNVKFVSTTFRFSYRRIPNVFAIASSIHFAGDRVLASTRKDEPMLFCAALSVMNSRRLVCLPQGQGQGISSLI
jgi:hypothetical protein